MKTQVYTVICVISTLFLVGSCQNWKLQDSQPNIVFVLADDLGWADLPVYGNKFNEAPNLSKLAEDGMRFDNAYAACPVCSPTRASIQSGQYPARVGITDFIKGHWRPYEEVVVPKNRTQYLPSEIVTFAEKLKEGGYATAYFGKWHLGWDDYEPMKQGYDEQAAYSGGGFYNYARYIKPSQEFSEGQILSEALTDLSLTFIEKNQNNPFFLFLSHYDVHVQLDAQDELIKKYLNKEKAEGYTCNAVYAAMIENIDTSVGRIDKKLKDLGLEKNTVFIFFSDNGGLRSRFDEVPLIANDKQHYYADDSLLYIASTNAPLRSEKGTVYEGGIREPFIVKWPGKIESGTLNHSLISSVDFYPTFLDLAGIEPDPVQILDGKSIKNILVENVEDYERAIFWHYPVYHHDVPASAVRKGDYKLIENLIDNSYQLYNLAEDISESRNLLDFETDKFEELKELLKSWQKQVKAEFPVPNPDFDPEKRHEWGRHPDWK